MKSQQTSGILKPGQLITVNRKVYRVTKTPSYFMFDCSECDCMSCDICINRIPVGYHLKFAKPERRQEVLRTCKYQKLNEHVTQIRQV